MWTALVLSSLFFPGILGDLVVQTPNGRVEGVSYSSSPSRKLYYAWRGIPYGRPPVGALRYLPPVKADPWYGVRDASRDSPACTFFGTFPSDPIPLYGNSEDCLYINVYSPVAIGSGSWVNPTRSVLVWIYGGGFFTGFSGFNFYDPAPFLEEDVIVVTFNYRLGAFGFLSTEDNVILGNAGLKDQVLALKWVRDNIASFGGNPRDITIFGESAGGMSVGYHVLSPLSRNLFKGAIMQSGTAVLGFHQTNAREYAVRLANRINPSITNSSTSVQIRNVLQAASVEQVQNLSDSMLAPVLEAESHESFLTQPLYETLESGNIARVPVIIGYTSEESLGQGTDPSMYVLQARMYDAMPELLVPGHMKLRGSTPIESIGREIHDQYVGRNGLFAENLGRLFEFMSDNNFVRSSHKHAILQSRFSPVYMFEFSYYGTLSEGNIMVPGAGKVAHAQEVGYLFNITTSRIRTQKDFLTRRRFVKLWTNFAKYSNPTPNDASADLLQHVRWEPISEYNVRYLDIDDNLVVKPSRKSRETLFWDYLWLSHSYRPYNVF